MPAKKSNPVLEELRLEIGRKVGELRRVRHLTQAELAQQVGLSQSRLSEIEKGDGSFTAEQLLVILQFFNVPISHFAPHRAGKHADTVQNALARLGALHLQESTEILPSEKLEEVRDVVREALLMAASPRHLTALAPVLVRNIEHLNLVTLEPVFIRAGMERRLPWLVENTLVAVRSELTAGMLRPWAQLYKRAEVALNLCLEFLTPAKIGGPSPSEIVATDILDADIRTQKTLEAVKAVSSDISRRWGIITSLQPQDFVEALRAAREGI